MAQTTNVGHMSAWSLARSRGYTGTREEYAELMASYATVAEQAAESAQSASSSAQGASQAASSANAAMNNALTAESNAQSAASGAQGYAQSAQTSASSAQASAQNAESAKNTAVSTVDGFDSHAQQALDSVNQAGNNWKSLAQAKALDSEAYALGTRDGEDVGSSDPAYHNNAKYYAESVSASAQTATEAAQTATVKAGEAQASASAAAESARTLTIDDTLTQAGQAADAKKTGDEITGLKEDLSAVKAYIVWSVKTGFLVRASDGKYVASSSYNSYEYPVYGLLKVFLTPYFTNATYGYAFYDKSKNFISNSGGTYDVATRMEITVPNGAYYIRFTENTTTSKPKLEADWGALLVTKATIKPTVDNSAEMYGDIYYNVQYSSDQGLTVQGKYYDTSGSLQTSSSFSTSGIVRVPYGSKEVYYYAYKNMSVPTMLFFDAEMNIVGTIVATEAATYGNLFYSGYATIPGTAVYYEVSFNTTAGQTVILRYSKPDNNNERINLLETDPLFGKKITCTGDSITAATHSYPGHGYVNQIAEEHGMTIDNQAIWGAVFAQNQVDGRGNARGCIYDTIALMDADADIVIISGGINDLEYYARAEYWGSITSTYEDTLDTETFCGALEGICKTALQKWSGKPIIFVFEHRMTIDSTTYGSFFKNTEYALMIQIFQKWGIPYVDLYHDMPSLSLNAGYKEAYTTGDGTHPNIAGYAKFYVPLVYSKIKEVMGL